MNEMQVRIRRPAASDAKAVSAISLMCCRDYQEQADVWTEGANHPQAGAGYWVAGAPVDGNPSGNAVVGYGRFSRERPVSPGTSKYQVYVGVHPDYWRAGIGSALFDQVVCELATLEAEVLRVRVRADQIETIGFFTKRGFAEYERNLHFELDLAHLDHEGLAGAAIRSVERLVAAGVSILNLEDYSRREADWLPRLLTAYNTLGADVPDADPYRPITPEGFRRFLADPDLPHTGFFVATTGSECIGYSYLLGTPGKEEVIVGMTGVLPEHRRHGIATALKIHGIRDALATGFKRMVTSTSGINVASVAVNEHLGFRKTHVEVRLERPLIP